MNLADSGDHLWLRSAYGSEVDAMLSRLGANEEQIENAVAKFYDSVAALPSAQSVLVNVSPAEFEHLRSKQVEYLVSILQPGITLEEHQQKAIDIGYRHCFVGLPTELLAESSILYTDIARTLAEGTSNEDRLKDIITRRLQFDLITQIGVYAAVQHQRLDVYNQIARQKTVGTPLDYLLSTLDTLLASFRRGAAGFAFGCVKNGTYRHLLAKGRVPFGASSEDNQHYPTVGIKEIDQAWFEEKSYIKNSLHEVPRIPEDLREECVTNEIRSFGFFLLHDLQHAPKAYLLVCGNYPGYFTNRSMLYFWHQMADLIGSQFDFLERSHGHRQRRLSDGFHCRQLLARQQVQMHYQPIIERETGQTVKLEALARLKDGDQTLSPAVFLPAFGANQLRDLFEIGLTQILDDLPAVSCNPPVCSINLPPEAMLDLEWLKALPDRLMQAGATPDRISLEILESALQDDKEVMKQIFAIKEAGYSIYLDDVGAGESSLLRLVNLPVSGIKIDQSFVRSLQRNFENLDLILSLRFLALQRGLECVAEGVENNDIVDALSNMCGGRLLLQGYAFARPMPSDALAEWLRQDATRTPVPPTPQTLYGWYSRHVGRLFTIRNALFTISDLISIESLQDAERCPLHAIIPAVGGDADITRAHYEWHANFARFAEMVQSGSTAIDLWQAMEASKLSLRELIEQKTNAQE